MRTLARVVGFVGLTFALTFGIAGLVGVNPVFADHTPDDVNCVNTHCVQGADLSSGDLTNFAEDGNFERAPDTALPQPRSWSGRSGTPPWDVVSSTACRAGTRCAQRTGNGTAGTATLTNSTQPDALAGQQFRINAAVRAASSTNGSAGVRIDWVLANGTVQAGPSANGSTALPNNWVLPSFTATAPTGAIRARIVLFATNTSGTWSIDTVELRRLSTLNDLVLANIDSRYPTRTSLTGGVPNTPGNPVSWGRLYNMPTEFTDGRDDTAAVRYARSSSDPCPGSDFSGYECDIASVPLPAGTFLLQGTVSLNNHSTSRATASCSLQLNGELITSGSLSSWDTGDAFNLRLTLPVQGVSTGAAGVATLTCNVHGNVSDGHLIATRVVTF